ncbi:MAG: hypothetical protein II648_03175 [Bacteroidales bacterium]|nr:hypothetical protein [Bacteroidales bacterium]
MNRALLLSAFVFVLFSCGKEKIPEDIPGQDDNRTTVFTATIEGDNQKSSWNKNDAITIFNRRGANDKYVFAGEDGVASGRFELAQEGTASSVKELDHAYALYPYSSSTVINGSGSISVVLPAALVYKQGSGVLNDNPMVAATDGDRLVFKSICGYLRFLFYGDNVNIKDVTLEGNNGEKLAGRASVTASIDGNPTVTMDASASDKITVSGSEGEDIILGQGTRSRSGIAEGYTEFVIAVPPVSFSKGFKLTVTDDMGAVFEKTITESVNVSGNKTEDVDAIEVSPDYSEVFVDFEDDNFKTYCLENFDSDSDGRISYSEARSVTAMEFDPGERDIRSIAGIGAFIHLKALKIAKPSKSFYDSDDKPIVQIPALDLSGNKELEVLICDYNGVESIDISDCDRLDTLSCLGNMLPYLDLRPNHALISVNCGRSETLTGVNVSGIGVKEFQCERNLVLEEIIAENCTDLQNLIVGGNPALSSIKMDGTTNLKLFFAQSNMYGAKYRPSRIDNLDFLNDCTELTDIACQFFGLKRLDVSHFPKLRQLACMWNELETIDVSNNPDLELFWCGNNKLTTIEGIRNCTRITNMYCYYNQLTNLDVSGLADMTIFNCSGNNLTSLNVSGCSSLPSLFCQDNKLESLSMDGCDSLVDVVVYNNNLAAIDLTGASDYVNLYIAADMLPVLKTITMRSGQDVYYYCTGVPDFTPSDYGIDVIVVE